MNSLRLSAMLLGGCALLAGTAATAADDKAANKEKIVGTWIVTKAGSDLPPEATIQFTKDGKLKISLKDPQGKTLTIDGTYTVEGDKLTVVMKEGEKEHKETMTIKTLTDTKLVTVDPKGKEDEFKKK